MNTLFTVNKSRRFSKINQEIYNTLEFIDADTGKLYKTYVSDSNFNSAYWDDLLDLMNQYPDQCFVLQGKFKLKRGHRDLITADTKFKISANFDRDTTLTGIWETHYA